MHKKSGQKTLRFVALILISLATIGCEKLGTTNTEKMPAIPSALGDLVAVTPGASPYQSILWFKQSDQTIVAVRVYAQGAIGAQMTKYPRN
jgi:hypothetical protein